MLPVMPATHSIDAAAGLVRLKLSGVLSAADMVETVKAVLAELEPGRSYDVLSDHRALEEPASRDQILGLVAFLTRHGTPFHGRRWAVIAAGPASYGMMRLLSVHAEAIPIEVMPFREPREAEAWLARTRAGPRTSEAAS